MIGYFRILIYCLGRESAMFPSRKIINGQPYYMKQNKYVIFCGNEELLWCFCIFQVICKLKYLSTSDIADSIALSIHPHMSPFSCMCSFQSFSAEVHVCFWSCDVMHLHLLNYCYFPSKGELQRCFKISRHLHVLHFKAGRPTLWWSTNEPLARKIISTGK